MPQRASNLNFAANLQEQLIHFSFKSNKGERSKPMRGSGLATLICGVESAPPHAGTWNGTKVELLSSKHPQHVCKTLKCQKRIVVASKVTGSAPLASVCILLK
jgi:hypothetical protein